MSDIQLNAFAREATGKAASRRMRRLEDVVPAIVYGNHQEPSNIAMLHKDIFGALEHESTYSSILSLNIDGKTEQVVLKEVQRHPFKPKITHVDFMRINTKEKITMTAPIHFTNEDVCVGVKEGGSASHLLNEVEIRCLPADLPEYLVVDVATVGMEKSLHLSDIKLPKGVEFAHAVDSDHDEPIFIVNKPKAAAEVADGAPEAPGQPEAQAQKAKDEA